MKNIKNILLIILTIMILFLGYDFITRKDNIVKVPIRIEVPVPSVEGKSDTVFMPVPVYVNNPLDKNLISENKKLMDKFKEADSLNKELQYQDAIAIKEYTEKFIDTFQTVEVYTKTRGELLEQSISYKTNKYTIPLDTTVSVKIKGKFQVYGQLEVGSNFIGTETFSKVVVKPSIILKNSKDYGISLSVDTQGIGWVGVLMKF